MNPNELKRSVCATIDEHSSEIIEFGEDIFAHPELGYMENRTSGRIERKFVELGLPYQKDIAVTGLKARMKGRAGRVTVAVIGEMDALVCPQHPNADPATGAAHACAHNAQVASMLGVAIGLKGSDAMRWLGGDVSFMAVPSEEGLGIPMDDSAAGRKIRELKESGRIQFSGGKQQFILEGALDDVDMAMMVHSGPMNSAMMQPSPHGKEYKMGVGGRFVGSVAKHVKFVGKSAHPGVSPHLGVNAQSAAALALMAINANREAFRDEDTVRVHAVITKGGTPHAIPDDVRMEAFIRSSSMEQLTEACRRVDRSLRGGAIAMGAEVFVDTAPGYMPFTSESAIDELFRNNAEDLVGKDMVGQQKLVAGTTDMGDVSHLIPAFHGRAGGITGRAHEPDYRIVDKYLAYVVPAKAMAMTIIDLLWDQAETAAGIKSNYKPRYNKETYLQAWRTILDPELD